MTYILNIETATKNCSVSIGKQGKTIACREIARQNFSHAEKLHVFIEEILYRVKRRIKNKTRLSVTDYMVQCKK